MSSHDEMYREALRATYIQLMTRLEPKEREPFIKTGSLVGIGPLASLIADRPYEGLHPFQEDMEVVESQMNEKFPDQEWEVSSIIEQITGRIIRGE